MPFSHPALPANVDAIRILELKPGDFLSPLVGVLRSVAFSDRPKYVALSYTWGNSYPDSSKLPIAFNDPRSTARSPSRSPDRSRINLVPGSRERRSSSIDQRITSNFLKPELDHLPEAGSVADQITLSDEPLRIGHNLQLALLHLRSPTHSINMWVDAICIDQLDTQERNQQVSLMAFIYTRALKVVAWLGVKNYQPMTGLFRSMSLEWKAGQTQHLGAHLCGESELRCSPKPDHGVFARVMDSSYWKRLWIVQEMCLPRLLLFAYGTEIWAFEEFKTWEYAPPRSVSAAWPTPADAEAAVRLLETRDKRHTDTMRLESLIERFAKNHCSDLKDRVYGLYGCANDVRPFAGQDEQSDALETHLHSFISGADQSNPMRRGMGSLKVDYDRSFFDIWMSVIGFAYFQANELERNVQDQKAMKRDATHTNKEDSEKSVEERRVSLVRFSGVLQDALGQMVEETTRCSDSMVSRESLRATRSDSKSDQDGNRHSPLKALGYIAGEIMSLGPDYPSLMGSSSAAHDWTSCWYSHYQDGSDIEQLRWINEEYMADMLDFHDTTLARIRAIESPHVIAWRDDVRGENARAYHHGHTTVREVSPSSVVVGTELPPRICLATSHVISLVPATALVGDVIVRFWNCDSAVVMRPDISHDTSGPFVLIGRADVAKVVDETGKALSSTQAKPNSWMTSLLPGSATKSHLGGAVYVDMDMMILQEISAHIAY
jgi:hypothetical protein